MNPPAHALLAFTTFAQSPAPNTPSRPPSTAAATHAILISVDGLRSDALIAVPSAPLPGFARLEAGAFTLNARCDPDMSVTLPNHASMITGRPVAGPAGHHWTKNGEPAEGDTLHKCHGGYLASIFDVAHDRGLRTALIAGKTKFAIFDTSFDAENGASDTTGTDEGRDKIDACVQTDDPVAATDALIAELARAPRTLTMIHYAVTDLTAHRYGWDVSAGSPYLKAVGAVDGQLSRLLDAIEASPELKEHTAIVLTTDHGGGAPFKSHDQPHMWVDYVIPFAVWCGAREGEHDLYALNAATRADPGLKQPPIVLDAAGASSPALPPIRNGEAGNVALALLGLPAIPDSVLNRMQDLRTR